MRWVHFPLHPETPTEGRALKDLFGSNDADIEQKYRQMKDRMDAEGLPYSMRTHTYNSRLAQELGKWADTQEDGDKLHDALYRAYFVDTQNIGQVDTLLKIVEQQEMDVDSAREALEQRRFKEAVDMDWMTSRQIGVTGVPTFVAGGQGVVGAQPYEVIEQLLQAAGAQPR